MPVSAIFPTVPRQAGFYESFYIRAVSPVEPVGVWIRHTVHKRPGELPRGSVWCTVFDATEPRREEFADGPFMYKQTADEVLTPPGAWIAVGDSSLSEDRCVGACGQASWSLRFAGRDAELRHLGAGWLYRAPLPRTKLTSPMPSASFSGTLAIGEHRIELADWPGMVGHNWGSEHAERWIWLHGIDFEQAPDTWLDVAIGRVMVGGRMSPWVANGALSLDGRRLRVGGLLARGLRVAESASRCSLSLPASHGARIEAHVKEPPAACAGWRYADPDGGQHDVLNCSIAALTLTVRLPQEPGRMLHSAHGGAYELGMREHDHGIALAPFADG